MVIDYNLLLVIGLILLFASNFVVLLSPGEGLLYLHAKGVHVQVPSWRAAFGGKLLVAINPLRVLQPTAHLQVFAAADAGSLALLDSAAVPLGALTRRTAPVAVAASLFMVVGLPAAILTHRHVAFVLLSVGMAYGSYLVVLFRAWRYSRHAALPTGLPTAAMEALFCLPYAAQMPRRASLLMLPNVSLAELLASSRPISSATIKTLQQRIQEYRDVIEEEVQQATLAQLAVLLQNRGAKDENP